MVKNKTTKCNSRSKSQCEKFGEEENDLKVKEVQEFAACHEAGPFILNLYVLGLNYYLE